MTDVAGIVYWAEAALEQPYVPRDNAWAVWARRRALALGGLACCVTASGLFVGGRLTLNEQPVPTRIIGLGLTDMAHIAPSPREPQAGDPGPRTKVRPPVPMIDPLQIPQVVIAPIPRSRKEGVVAKNAPKTTSRTRSMDAGKKFQAPAETALTSTDAARLPKQPENPKPSVPVPAAEPASRLSSVHDAPNKPVDIAPGLKLGIREVLADGIIMQNGRKVQNGSPLPNGEVLLGTDPSKGIAETNRRILVLTQ